MKQTRKVSDLERFIQVLSRLPVGHHLNLCVERSEETREPYLAGCLIESPPEGGWPTLAAYFGHAPDGPDQPATPYRDDDAARVGITTGRTAYPAFARLLTSMMRSYVKRVQGKSPPIA